MAKQSGELAAATSLDTKFKAWLERLRRKWRLNSVADASKSVDWGEVQSRLDNYGRLAEELEARELDVPEVHDLLKDCWALGERYGAIRLSEFLADRRSAAAIKRLVRGFPKHKKEAAARIDEFVQRAVEIAYRTPTDTKDFSGAALLASVLLISLEPKRFVDYRKNRWSEIEDIFPNGASYGEQLIAAGELARAVCRTPTFRRFWPQARIREPLWALSGICWSGANRTKPRKQLPEADEIFAEGGVYERLARLYKRNRQLVIWKKQAAQGQDPSMPCEVCNFSFEEAYGKIGRGFIEAHHHLKPVSRLKVNHPGNIDDLATVCANCHRMLDRERLSIQELKRIVAANRKRSHRS